MVTTKPPIWREPLVLWPEDSPTLGEPAHGFFYPDPLGFWSEVRRWAAVLLRLRQPTWNAATALSVTTLLHVGDDPARLAWARHVLQPRLLLFLDEPSWQAAAIDARTRLHHVPDPHRQGQVYEGVWGTDGDGLVVGKSPQHPATHNLYRTDDMDHYLASAPVRR